MTQLRDGASGAAGTAVPAAPDAFRESLIRRELHSSRAVASIIAAFLLAALCLYLLLEVVLRAIGQPPWLLDHGGFAAWLHQLPGNVSPLILGTSGLLVLLAGLFFFLQAVLPGRL
ncbi:hypothetical protein HER39_13760, partial [Arthrobacter deserti]|nr:hypothetical protein [Arthrobacter deserti]